jgi:hypothetical protein
LLCKNEMHIGRTNVFPPTHFPMIDRRDLQRSLEIGASRILKNQNKY